MENFEKIKQSEQKEKGVEISQTKEFATILFHNLELNAQNSASPEITLIVEKQPIQLSEGKSYGDKAVFIDKETKTMRTMAQKAEALLGVPEKERPGKVLELLRERMYYAYNDVIEKVAETDPELAQWVALNTGINSEVNEIPLSELIEKQYGVCRHLAVVYLWLAQKAGLKGAIFGSGHSVIKNIERTDNKEKLFKSAEISQRLPAHAWVELKMSNGRWLPVDPSTKLVGDTKENLAMFRKANYIAVGRDGLDLETEPRELGARGGNLPLRAGQNRAEAKYCLELISTKPILRIGSKDLPPANIPYSGEGKMTLKTNESRGMMRLEIVDIKR